MSPQPLTDTRDEAKENVGVEARKGRCSGGERWEDGVGEEFKSARKTTVHCFYLVVSPPCPNWQKDLAHFNVSLAEAEHCTSHA